MRRFVLICLVLAACGQPERRETARTLDVREEAASGPNVRVSAAPGVAFNYSYAYSLPDERIAQVQEAHAASCEQLGLSRCRVTGMRYNVASGDTVTAMLAVKLAPDLARQFGTAATVAVTRNNGKLIEAEITGEDAGAKIADASQAVDAARRELREVEARLATGLPPGERDNLLQRATELRAQLGQAQDVRQTAQASLATTPMTFTYGSGRDLPGFGRIVSVRQALATGWDSFAALISFLLMAVALAGPWVLLAGLVFLVARRLRVRFRRDPFALGDEDASRP